MSAVALCMMVCIPERQWLRPCVHLRLPPEALTICPTQNNTCISLYRHRNYHSRFNWRPACNRKYKRYIITSFNCRLFISLSLSVNDRWLRRFAKHSLIEKQFNWAKHTHITPTHSTDNLCYLCQYRMTTSFPVALNRLK